MSAYSYAYGLTNIIYPRWEPIRSNCSDRRGLWLILIHGRNVIFSVSPADMDALNFCSHSIICFDKIRYLQYQPGQRSPERLWFKVVRRGVWAEAGLHLSNLKIYLPTVRWRGLTWSGRHPLVPLLWADKGRAFRVLQCKTLTDSMMVAGIGESLILLRPR